jgi:Domain of unknown function (DUF4326)
VAETEPGDPLRHQAHKWANPFRVEEHGREKALELYRATLFGDQDETLRVLRHNVAMVQRELRGRDLGSSARSISRAMPICCWRSPTGEASE